MKSAKQILNLLDQVDSAFDTAKKTILTGRESTYYSSSNAIHLLDTYEELRLCLDIREPARFVFDLTYLWEAETSVNMVAMMLQSDLTHPGPVRFVWDSDYYRLRELSRQELETARRKYQQRRVQ